MKYYCKLMYFFILTYQLGIVDFKQMCCLKTYIFLLPTYLVYQNLFCGTNLSSINLETRHKTGKYLWNRENVTKVFPRSSYRIQVLNEFPTDKRHIKVPQDRLLCSTHVDNKKKQAFQNFLCVTRPDLSGVPLTVKIPEDG